MKTVVITGASSGIGKATADFLSREYHIINIDITPDESYELYRCDLSKKEQILETVERIREKHSSIYALVNNVAKMVTKELQDQLIEDWEEVISTNLTAPYILSKELAPMLTKKRGHIINISSTRAKMSEAGTESYSASKGGIEALTHALAISLGGQVAVNSISPGWINTDKNYTPTDEEHKDHPVKRVGVPLDIAKCVYYLLQDEGGFITGSNFVIDGGMTRKMVYV